MKNRNETGQGLIEYGLLVVFIAVALLLTLPIVGKAVNNIFSTTASSLITGQSGS